MSNRRLIPAWAGKTAHCVHAGADVQAHPRVGGENHRLTSGLEDAGGSSPRGRGKRVHAPGWRAHVRLIPAWAGKTTTIRWSSWPGAAHPRVGGENLLTSMASSPP